VRETVEERYTLTD